MASLTSHRPTGDSCYDDDDEDLEHQVYSVGGCDLDGRTPVSFSTGRWVRLIMEMQLDRTIDRIGMGRYQWTLLSLCGFGDFLSLQILVLAQFLCRLDGRQCLQSY